MTDESLTVDDEIVARARIHARDVAIDVDWECLEWAVSARAKRRAGACRWDGEVATIVLSRRAYEAYDWAQFAAVVRHELVHAWEFQRHGKSGHGERFRREARRLEAPRHCEAFTDPRYLLRCLGGECTWESRRHQASKPVRTPENYRCGSCGGDYEVEHVSSGRSWKTAAGYGGAKAALGEEW
ncbi:SprT-like domain-containing protein [Natrononativus amylolyticus]|uniref:SprT family zinc-dependent metalloprotease n=1 Tax=Natrononativus amylolyticus TaxID=2963434 RepID=UPI0020CBA26F|nr:SprT-like domain-containing protein [Natrononativus amylolyticus]